ncbi:Sir2 family NAD-dependent protein deacetylase [Achromobacter arsenitoxydans]|uniref:protein acetyllysine N-acetyltransferase n=1 Tax=Achromobacter arsenitoxydans SY8 TaxID=477184 RepID=H0F9R0_9BURK|nr:Sir2 family NAD-dependent protein deacetylase [Achromobacter arsenitoxydans]EHK64904.1 silent information regulator protein Sir2 [Achromobacter arsenitoxydans SY8]
MKPRKLHLPESLLQSVRAARNIVVLTGSGLNPASRLPLARDGMRGLWARYDSAALATEEGFRRDPALVWAWHEERRRRARLAAPNAAHRAIAELAVRSPGAFVVTQNGDTLHERAGSPRILHLLGRFDQPRCSACAMPYTLAAPPAKPGRQGPFPPPPACRICGNLVRPGRLWHGEPPASDVWAIAKGLAAAADLILAVGTSCETPAAAEFCYAAMADGAELVQINPNPTLLDRVAAHNIKGPAEKILPLLLARAWPGA